MAGSSGGGGGASAPPNSPAPTLLSLLVKWLTGRATWVLAKGLGAALAAPLGLQLLVQLVTRCGEGRGACSCSRQGFVRLLLTSGLQYAIRTAVRSVPNWPPVSPAKAAAHSLRPEAHTMGTVCSVCMSSPRQRCGLPTPLVAAARGARCGARTAWPWPCQTPCLAWLTSGSRQPPASSERRSAVG